MPLFAVELTRPLVAGRRAVCAGAIYRDLDTVAHGLGCDRVVLRRSWAEFLLGLVQLPGAGGMAAGERETQLVLYLSPVGYLY